MRKTLTAMIAAAAVLIIGGALGAVAQTESETDTGDTTVAETEATRPVRGHLIENLLDEMVTDGVIDAIQADDIATWLEERRAELAAEREAKRAAFEAAWEDGVLTEDEVGDFPHADRLLAEDGPFAEAWADGELTREEFDAVRGGFPGRRGPHRGAGLSGFGPGSNA